MPITVNDIINGSLADNSKLNIHDRIISINGNEINDFLDLQFYTADEVLIIIYLDNSGIEHSLEIIQDWKTSVGIIPQQPKCRTCANDCIFCFVDQMPDNLRDTLYIKDDDYRFSFVFGNFITLTNLSDKDISQMIEQKLNPLYISVHTTNPALHKKMLRYKHDLNIMKKLEFLSKNGIEFHTQIVVIPNWNDDKELESTLIDLTSPKLNSLSVGIVPVGLSKFRSSLTQLFPVNSKQAAQILKLSSKFPRTYCSDEIYLLANEKIPPEEFYDDYPQLENGIGMIRLLLENWKLNKIEFISDIQTMKEKIVFITGKLAYSTILRISNEINQLHPQKTRTVEITNNAFGENITVAGLLTASDILDQVKLDVNEIPALSSNIFNEDDLTIDGLSKDELRELLDSQLLIIDEEFDKWTFFHKKIILF
jgi:putative radical SAM enzyme (TIGR03279 family)